MSIEAMKQALEALEAVMWSRHLEDARTIAKNARYSLRQAIEQAEKEQATIENNSQDWAGMDGAIAYQLIERHSNTWADARKMMHEWLEANQREQAEKQFNPDWDQQAVLVERIRELEAQLYGQAEKQVPVAYAAVINGEIDWNADYPFSNEPFTCFDDENAVPLYTAPPCKESEQDLNVGIDVTEDGTSLVIRRGNEIIKSEFYKAPRKEWVGLTDEELIELKRQWVSGEFSWVVFDFLNAIEAKLKEKNT